MELSDLIAAVQAAKTKNELAELVGAELSLDLNKNKTLKVLRAEVLNGLGITEGADSSAEDVDGATEAEHSDEDEVVTTEVAADAVVETQPLVIPPAEDAPPEPSKADPENRLIRNKVTGVTFIWTAALSKLSVMEEV